MTYSVFMNLSQTARDSASQYDKLETRYVSEYPKRKIILFDIVLLNLTEIVPIIKIQ